MPQFEKLPDWWRRPIDGESPTRDEDVYRNVRRSGFFAKLDSAGAAGAFRPAFIPSPAAIVARSTLGWAEHCLECAAPACYEACDMFVATDNGCRRFKYGIEKTERFKTLHDFSYRVVFLPWGNLLAVVSKPISDYDGFLAHIYNPYPETVSVVIDFRGPVQRDRVRFMTEERISTGLNQLFYPVDAIARFLPGTYLREIAVAPDTVAPETLMFFPILEFVRFQRMLKNIDPGRVKCVALDLDGTLWQGTLVEDGSENLIVNSKIVEYIRLLQRHGIVTSIASRNDPAEALAVLRSKGLDDLFVFPQIGWQPKSVSLRRVAESLRIGVDALALVDDSPYERGEVEAVLPQTQVLGPGELERLCQDIVFKGGGPTSAGRERFGYYRQEEARQDAESRAAGSHLEFLKSLGATVTMALVRDSEMGRVQELIQRTNQLNFSNHRYARPEVEEFARDRSRFRCSTITAGDRFGDYGLIGFSIVDVSDPTRWWIRDLMFSCRILGRHVDVFTLTQILEDARCRGVPKVTATFISNGRNDVAREALRDAGFVHTDEGEFSFDLRTKEIPRIDYIKLNS